MPRRRRHFVKRAVDAITNFEFVFERLEMDVARAVLDRLIQDQIDEANDRAWRSPPLRPLPRVSSPRSCHQLAGFAELLEDVLHAGGVGAVVALDPLFDLLGRGDDDVDVFAEGEAQIFRRARIERIDQRDLQHVIRETDRQERDAAGPDRPESIFRMRGINLAIGKIDEFRPERVGDGSIKSVPHRRSRRRPSPVRSVLPFTFASCKTSSACDGCRTCCSTKRSATCCVRSRAC